MNRNGAEQTPTTAGYIKTLVGYCIYVVWEWMVSGIVSDILDMLFVQDENDVDAIYDILHDDHEFVYVLYAFILSDIQNEPITNK